MSQNNKSSEKYHECLETTHEVGFVREVFHPVVLVEGLPGARMLEVVFFESGPMGIVTAVTESRVEILILSSSSVLLESSVSRSNRFLGIKIGPAILGSSLDSLGRPLGSEIISLEDSIFSLVDVAPSGISERDKVSEPLETGVSVVDLMVPLGKGQRELVLGDRKTGKTEFIFQTMLNQVKDNSVVVYAAIGKKKTSIKSSMEFIKKYGLENNSVVVATGASDPLGLLYLNPFTAMTIAEYFRNQGKDVLLVLDDLTTHAKFYREMSLIARKFPGREAYPGDIFHMHARLLERAGNFPKGSITCLPVVETVEGDVSGYIQTNLMSITDGHLFFDTELFKKGRHPAVNTFLSVTRVGRQTQSKLRWGANRELTSFFTLLDKTENFIHFGSEINEGIKATVEMGEVLVSFLNQPLKETTPLKIQILFYGLIWVRGFKSTSVEDVRKYLAQSSHRYKTDAVFRSKIDELVVETDEFNAFLGKISTKVDSLVDMVGEGYEKK
jgi:F-type H+/Na+-transporting ATPase subunit alpha